MNNRFERNKIEHLKRYLNTHYYNEDDLFLFLEAAYLIIDYQVATIKLLREYFNMRFTQAEALMDDLYEAGIVGEEFGYNKREIFWTMPEFEQLLCDIGIVENDHPAKDKSGRDIEYVDIRNITGEEFENICVGMLKHNGFDHVFTTKTTGDRGVDIKAYKDGKFYSIQCKCYAKSVGNKAIQEAHAGQAIYKSDVAVVMTNSYFTDPAIKDAVSLNVELWDRDYILRHFGVEFSKRPKAKKYRKK